MLGRLVGIANLLLMFVLCVFVHSVYIRTFPISTNAAWVTLGFLLAMTAGFFVVTSSGALKAANKLNRSLAAVFETLTIYRKKKVYLVISFFISTLLQIMVLLRHYFCAQAVGLEVDFFTLSFISILVMGLTTLPITINGVGLRENGFVFLLGIIAIPVEKALTFSLLNYALMVSMAAFGGIAYVKGVKDHRVPDLSVLSVKEMKEKAAAL